jgi:hypothetical protein
MYLELGIQSRAGAILLPSGNIPFRLKIINIEEKGQEKTNECTSSWECPFLSKCHPFDQCRFHEIQKKKKK